MKNFDLVESAAPIEKVQRTDNHIDGANLMMEGLKGRLYEKSSSDKMYPHLPKLDIEATQLAADSKSPMMNLANLNDRDLRTAIRAEQSVQERMTPRERHQLHQDKIEYDKAVERHNRADMMGALPFGYNKEKKKPASLQRYENAVSQEISKKDPSFHSRNFLIDGTYHQPRETFRPETAPKQRENWLKEVILY